MSNNLKTGWDTYELLKGTKIVSYEENNSNVDTGYIYALDDQT